MIGAVTQTIGGLTSIASGIIGGGKRRAEQRAAEKELAINKARYENLDTSNLAANMENAYEDLTVNTQAADFAAQQQQQVLANTMSGMNQAAGGSGIAALAQAMAGQQSANAQASAASIGQQESANQRAAAQGAMAVQSAQIQGAQAARQAEAAKTETLLGMSQQRKAAADEARAQATKAITSGIGNVVGGAASGIASMGAAGKLKGSPLEGVGNFLNMS
jgi:hypothetical protein